MIRWYRIPEDRVTVVYNGVDLEHFHPEEPSVPGGDQEKTRHRGSVCSPLRFQ